MAEGSSRRRLAARSEGEGQLSERLPHYAALPLIVMLALLAWLPMTLLIYMIPFWAFCPHPLTVLWALFGG